MTTTTKSGILEVRDLVRQYTVGAERVVALDRVSFSVAAGSTVAVVGASGSGKSTLLGLIAGLDRPDAGEVLIAGQNLATLSETARSRLRATQLGFVFQSYRLLPTFTARENVALAAELAGLPDAFARADTWLERIGLGARGHHVPTRLSGGEQQRVALARALVAGPRLVLADEPTGNLDSRNGAAVTDLLLKLAADNGTTVLLVTHDDTVAQRCGRIIRLVDGRIVADNGG